MSKKAKRQEAEPMSKKEKITFSVIFGVGAALILLIILLNINWGVSTDKQNILDEYSKLENTSHVFETIKFADLKEKFENGEEFHLYIGRPSDTRSQNFVPIANNLAKEVGVRVIYYLNISTFTSNSFRELAVIINEQYPDFSSSSSNFLPSLVYFEKDNDTNHSEAIAKSGLEYSGNETSAIRAYFRLCGYTFE